VAVYFPGAWHQGSQEPFNAASRFVMTFVWLILTVLVSVIMVVSVIVLLLSHLSTARHFKRPNAQSLPNLAPSVSILKPVEGAGEETYKAFASFCQLVYPGKIEILVGTIRPDDAIKPIVDRLRKNFSEQDIRLVFTEPKGTNRKASIMEVLWREASGDYLFFSDADVVVSSDYLQRLVPLLAQPGVGCVTCLPRGIEARSLGGKLIALHYDFNYLPQWMLAVRTTGIKWAIGHTMAVHRNVLLHLGGFKAWLNHLADDYELGHRVSRMGLKVIVPPYLIDCFMPREDFWAAIRRLQRWKRTMRRARGVAFLGSSLTYPVFWGSLLITLCPFACWSWIAFVITLAIRGLLAIWLQSFVRLPDWKRIWWLLPLVDIIEGITFVGAYTGKTIYWAGRRYDLAADGTLASVAKKPGKH